MLLFTILKSERTGRSLVFAIYNIQSVYGLLSPLNLLQSLYIGVDMSLTLLSSCVFYTCRNNRAWKLTFSTAHWIIVDLLARQQFCWEQQNAQLYIWLVQYSLRPHTHKLALTHQKCDKEPQQEHTVRTVWSRWHYTMFLLFFVRSDPLSRLVVGRW